LDEEAAVTWKFQKEERIVNRNLKGNPTIFICLPSYALQRLIPVQDKSKKKVRQLIHPFRQAARLPFNPCHSKATTQSCPRMFHRPWTSSG
jgi:hypothetical protein